MKKKSLILLITGIFMLFFYGCSDSDDNNSPKDPAEPEFNASLFSNPTKINNKYLPLIPGTIHLYQVETEDGVETIVTEILEETRVVDGVESLVFHDRVFLDELLIEDTHDWFAQDDNGNVWYMGEEVINYEYDDEGELIETNNDGAWESGVDGALAGILIKADPVVGDSYQQEFYPGKAEDMAMVEELGVTVALADGTIYTDCLKTLEWNPLEQDSNEYKYYAPNVGLVKEEEVDGEEAVELKGIFLTGEDRVPDFDAAVFTDPATIDNMYLPLTSGTILTYQAETEDGTETIITEVLETTRFVYGIECVVFQDLEFIDEGDGDVLIEDTKDWFAQDDDGNVWYMGEEVINYEYNDEGELIETNSDGEWEAGVDGALPGILMWANPVMGKSYYQEYYEDEAEDMGLVVADGIEVELEDGSIYENCLQVLDWNPLEPETLEYKYYAPNLGLVKEEMVGGDEVLELTMEE